MESSSADFVTQVLDTVIFLANAAARRTQASSGNASDSTAARLNKAIDGCLTIILYQLSKHQAPGSAAQLQVSTGCCTAFLSADRQPVFSA